MTQTITKHKRIKLSPKKYIELKLKVFERDKCCVLCGKEPTDLHHVKYRSAGGDDTMQNCVMLCTMCHELAHGADARDIRTVLLQYLEMLNNEFNR